MEAISLAGDFREFLRLLNSAEVEYIVVGGYAVAVHGHPRATGDLDIWVDVNDQTAQSLVDVLRSFGFATSELAPALFKSPDRIIRMGLPPVRIEILTGITGVTFAECRSRALRVTLDGVSVCVISKADLLENKRAAGRAKDLADVEALERDA